MWFKVDDDFHSHPKALLAGNAALGLWVRLGSWCGKHMTGGLVPRQVAASMGRAKEVQKLIEVGLVEGSGDDLKLHDWDVYNPTAEESASLREKRSAAGRLGARKRWSNSSKTDGKPVAGAMASAIANDVAKRCPVPVPVPVPVLDRGAKAPLSFWGPEHQRVWEHFVSQRLARLGKGSRRPKLDDKRRTHVRARVKEYGEEQVVAAIDVLFADDSWHVRNNRTAPEYVFRSNDQLEKLLDRLEPSNDYERDRREIEAELDERTRAAKTFTPPMVAGDARVEFLHGR